MAAFPGGPFCGAQGCIAAPFIAGPRAIVTGEDDQGVVIQAEVFEFVEQDIGGPVDAGDGRTVDTVLGVANKAG